MRSRLHRTITTTLRNAAPHALLLGQPVAPHVTDLLLTCWLARELPRERMRAFARHAAPGGPVDAS